MPPISAKEFEEKGVAAEKRQKGRRQQEVMRFLNQNSGQAYTQSEVQKALGLSSPQHARSILLSLETKGRVARRAIENQVYYSTLEVTKKGK